MAKLVSWPLALLVGEASRGRTCAEALEPPMIYEAKVMVNLSHGQAIELLFENTTTLVVYPHAQKSADADPTAPSRPRARSGTGRRSTLGQAVLAVNRDGRGTVAPFSRHRIGRDFIMR